MACVVVNGNPWFRGKYVAKLLEYAGAKRAIATNVSEDNRNKMKKLLGVWDTTPT
ncbi:MAG: Bro-N domain-containing protein [Candidatus Fonsibacter sp.]